MATPTYLTVRDIAERLSLSRSTVHRYIASGDLRSITLGGSRRVSEEDLEEFMMRMSAGT